MRTASVFSLPVYCAVLYSALPCQLCSLPPTPRHATSANPRPSCRHPTHPRRRPHLAMATLVPRSQSYLPPQHGPQTTRPRPRHLRCRTLHNCYSSRPARIQGTQSSIVRHDSRLRLAARYQHRRFRPPCLRKTRPGTCSCTATPH